MKIRTEPLLGGAAFSFTILLVVYILLLMVSMNYLQQMMDFVVTATYESTPPLASPFLYISSCMACLAPLIAGIGSGVIYARQHAKIEPITGSLIGGGAASGALGFFIAIMVVGIVSSFMMIPIMNQFTSLVPEMSDSMGMYSGITVVSSLMYSVCYGFFYAAIGAVLGLIGAAVGTPKSAKAADVAEI